MPLVSFRLTRTAVRWDPDGPGGIFFHQSAILFSHSHQLRILIHRSNLQTSKSRRSTGTLMPSLTICASSARASCGMLEVYLERDYPIAQIQFFRVSALTMTRLRQWTDVSRTICIHRRSRSLPQSSCLLRSGARDLASEQPKTKIFRGSICVRVFCVRARNGVSFPGYDFLVTHLYA